MREGALWSGMPRKSSASPWGRSGPGGGGGGTHGFCSRDTVRISSSRTIVASTAGAGGGGGRSRVRELEPVGGPGHARFDEEHLAVLGIPEQARLDVGAHLLVQGIHELGD